jgi:hypothetical protein
MDGFQDEAPAALMAAAESNHSANPASMAVFALESNSQLESC